MGMITGKKAHLRDYIYDIGGLYDDDDGDLYLQFWCGLPNKAGAMDGGDDELIDGKLKSLFSDFTRKQISASECMHLLGLPDGMALEEVAEEVEQRLLNSGATHI